MAELNDILPDLVVPKFDPKPYFSPTGDCLFYFFEDTRYYEDRIDGIITVFRAMDNQRIIGFQIKSVTKLLEESEKFEVSFEDGTIRLGALLMLASYATDDAVVAARVHVKRRVVLELASRVGEEVFISPEAA